MRIIFIVFILTTIESCQNNVHVPTNILDLKPEEVLKISIVPIDFILKGSSDIIEIYDVQKINAFMHEIEQWKPLKRHYISYRPAYGSLELGFSMRDGSTKYANLIFTCQDGNILGMGAFEDDVNVNLEKMIVKYGHFPRKCR